MQTIKDKIQQHINTVSIAELFIYSNIAVFSIVFLSKAVATLMQWGENPLFDWLALPSILEHFYSKPWTLLSYGFLHSGFIHLLFNSLLLYYFGNLFLDFFSKRDFLIYYFSGIIFGGLIYLVSYNIFPALMKVNSSLVGASAGIMAILIGIATKIPNYAMQFRFIGGIKLWHIAIGVLILDIIQMPIQNTGGHIAHLGGALIGFLLTTKINKGKNLSSLFSFIKISKKQSPLKTVYKNTNPISNSRTSSNHQRKIDAILDKISKSGYETLSQSEKDFLFSIGKK